MFGEKRVAGEKLHVKISVSGESKMTDKLREAYNGFYHFGERMSFEFKTTGIDPKDQSVFIHILNSSHEPLCWWRGVVAEFLDPRPSMDYITMKPDGVVEKMKNYRQEKKSDISEKK